MALSRYMNRRDKAEAGIVAVLRQLGFHVVRMDLPADALASRRGHWHVLEFKTGTGSLSPRQREFHAAARAPVTVLRDEGGAVDWAATVP